MSEPAAGQGGSRSSAAQRRQPAQPSGGQRGRKSALGLTPMNPPASSSPMAMAPMTAKQGRAQYAGRPPGGGVPAPNRNPDPGSGGGGGRQRPVETGNRPPSGLGAWIRRRRTRAHLGYLPKWTARRVEPFGIGGLHWLPSPTNDNRGPAIVLHGGDSMLLALAEMSPAALRGPESANLGARLAAVLTAFASPAASSAAAANSATGPAGPSRQGNPVPGFGPAPGQSAPNPAPVPPPSPSRSPYQRATGQAGTAYRPSLARIQVLHQVPGSAGRTRSYLVLGFRYDGALVEHAARLGQGERGVSVIAARAAENVFAMLSDPGPRGGRLGTLVPLDRPAWTRLLGALILPGRGDLVATQGAAPAWRPTEIDALAPRYIAVTAPIGTAGQSSTWWHATGWVKRWPNGLGGLDLAACAGFLPPGVTGTASVVLGLRRGEDRALMPTVAGYLTVSGHDAVEVELARVAAHAAADARDGFVEFCDRSHHTAFADTLPLARGLTG